METPRSSAGLTS